MFIVAATALATLDISKAVDERGAVVEPVLEAMNGSVRYVFTYFQTTDY